jgi:hypothetical protein
MRLAHGWSQQQAAERWTDIWPDDPKTFKNFSYWEQWPAQTGHAPSLGTLDRLARLYECKITDLLGDCRDYGEKRMPGPALRDPMPAKLAPPGGGAGALAARILSRRRHAREIAANGGSPPYQAHEAPQSDGTVVPPA